MEDLPIDIHYNKLLFWLSDRKWVKGAWQKPVEDIRHRVNDAIVDMPDHETITKLLADSFITYFHCIQIVDVLRTTEADTKNFFGSYSSQRMKDWNEIVRLYEGDNCYLGECANILMHNVTYEIPALKRGMAQNQQKIADCDRKEAEYGQNSAAYKRRFEATCREMKIKGENIRAELLSLVTELPAVFKEVEGTVQGNSFKTALDYYEAFIRFTIGDEVKVCALLRFMQVHGNTSVHKYRTGNELPADSSVAGTSSAAAGDADDGGIDWGDDAGGDDGGIDWGDGGTGAIEVAVGGDDDGGIDWGLDGADESAAPGDGGDGGIDWGDDGADGADGAISVAAADDGGIDWGNAGGINFGDDAGPTPGIMLEGEGEVVTTRDNLLEHSETRNELIDQVLELEGFLAQRAVEATAALDITAINQFQGAPKIIQMQSQESIEAMLAVLKTANELLTKPRTQQLLLLSTSPKYVDRLALTLTQRMDLSQKMLGKIGELDTQRKNAAGQIAAAKPRLDMMVAQTKSLQAQIEKDLSKKYKGREVNIIGEINSL